MSSWARRAADIGSVVTSCGHPGSSAPAYPYRLEKVKFGVPLDEVCKNNENIPGPLLVLILKLNKESPSRRDVFRAPGHQGAMKKLIHFLQAGRLVNVDNYSVYTIASVLKKFLRKIPNGIFGRAGEKELFAIIELENEIEQTDRLHRLLTSLPKYTQHLLVLLFGTFRVIASNAAHAETGMTSEALGVSVAPSFFQSCVSDGKTARMEDVLKFKVATKIMKHIIDKFATHDLFGRDNYEYYARVTGRILKVQDEWICSFQYPPPPRGKLAQQKYALQHSLEAEKTWLQCQCERWGLLAQEESRSTPALLTSSSSALDNSVLSLGVTPEHSFIESCARLSVSLEGPGLFAMTSSPIPKLSELQHDNDDADADDDDEDEEEHYADDDDEDDFAAELDISNDDDIENNPKHNLLHKNTTASTSATIGSARVCSSGKQQTRYAAAAANAATDIVVSSLDFDDNDDDDMTVVKRRYRQNKKKPLGQTRMQQHQRRLRAGSKSLDGGSNENNSAGVNMAASSTGASACTTSTGKAKPTNTAVTTTTSTTKLKTRTCSRCNRGIRHSSSCSSASGGGAGGGGANGSGMTMDELRAVNRYAESTKSLSYLPQVHERQTARMRTRSEWFLGPKDDDDDGIVVTLQLPNTCSSCCLAAVVQQQQQQQYHSYLGGGSTRDMRRPYHHNELFGDKNDADDNNDDVRSTGNAFYLFYKKQQQQQQQHQQQQYLQAEHMDTDESIDYDSTQIHSTTTTITTPAFLTLPPQQQHQQSIATISYTGGGTTVARAGGFNDTTGASSSAAAAAAVTAVIGTRRLYLDTNSGSYVASNSTTNNIHFTTIYDSNNTTTSNDTTTINTTLPSSTIDNNIQEQQQQQQPYHHQKHNNNKYYYDNHKFCYYNNNKENNNNQNNNNYTLSNRQHLIKNHQQRKNHLKKRTSLDLSYYNYNYSNNHNNNDSSSNTNNNNSSKYLSQQQQQHYNPSASLPTQSQQKQQFKHKPHKHPHRQHYYSTDSLRFCDDVIDVVFDTNGENLVNAAAVGVTANVQQKRISAATRCVAGGKAEVGAGRSLDETGWETENLASNNSQTSATPPTKLYQSPRKKQTLFRRSSSTYDLASASNVFFDEQQQHFAYSLPTATETQQYSQFVSSSPSSLHDSPLQQQQQYHKMYESCTSAADVVGSGGTTADANAVIANEASHTFAVTATSATSAASNSDAEEAVEEVDYVLTSRFRHSTPISQRRRRLRLHSPRPRISSNASTSISSSSSYYQSLNSAASTIPMSRGRGRGGGGASGDDSSINGSSNSNNNNNNRSGNIGNVRLSNSAESVQYPARRTSSRRLIGASVPRQYPLRSSLRRNKEKQIGSSTTTASGSGGSNGNNIADSNTAINVTAVTAAAMLSGVHGGICNQPPSVRNSIAECCGNITIGNNILTPTFACNRLEVRAASFEHQKKDAAESYMDADDLETCCSNSRTNDILMMDTTEAVDTKNEISVASGNGSGRNLYSTTTATLRNISRSPALPTSAAASLVRNLENVTASQLQLQQHHQQQQQSTQQQCDETMSTITFKAPRV